ncbi:MAG: DUF5067 domain-containing protein [Clostridia bacterium]|nr:DUF5067 domain-containing protein [Clostridia bacterium]
MSKSMVAVITAVITAVVSVCSTLVVVKYTGEDGTEKEVRAEIQYEENGGDGAVFEPYELSGGQQTVSGDTSVYNVDILSAKIALDDDNNKVVVVTYSFTNNSDEPEHFEWTVRGGAYQNGIELGKAYGYPINDNSDDTSPEFKDVRVGSTFKFEYPYILSNETDDVLIELTAGSGPDFTISRTFTLS